MIKLAARMQHVLGGKRSDTAYVAGGFGSCDHSCQCVG
jgi:hypothetical protein